MVLLRKRSSLIQRGDERRVKLLFVNACPRGEDSRTLRLTRTFLAALAGRLPDCEVTEEALYPVTLAPVDSALLAHKEALCDRRAWNDPLFAPATRLQSADMVVIAAPYWDLSFPSALKLWVEHCYVRNLTFHYEGSRCVGMCRGRLAVYLTTAGSPIGENDWGAGYIQAVLRALGIPRFTALSAQGLDLEENDAEALLQDAMERAAALADEIAQNEKPGLRKAGRKTRAAGADQRDRSNT